MKITSSSFLLSSLLSLTTTTVVVNAQFTCTLSATDESSCLDAKDDDSSHCVWCAVGGFGFCVGESQAEKMENSIPGIECDRNSDDNDDDDSTPNNDDDSTPPPPPPPTDDTVPDNFWTCLQDKTSKECDKDGCTWCDTKGGFGLCLTGPTADSASQSDWFDCKSSTSLSTNVVVNNDFDEEEEEEELEDVVKDPYDTSCLLAYLQDPTEEGCHAAVDQDGGACEYCDLNGSLNLCLTEEQADMGQQIGLTCSSSSSSSSSSSEKMITKEVALVVDMKDPYDPTCVLAFLQDQSKETCINTNDSDGNSCEYCTLQGSLNLCLNEEQAEMGQQLGIECDDGQSSTVVVEEEDNDDAVDLPPDFFKCLQNFEQDGCADSDCTWCTTEVGIGFCLSTPAAKSTSDCTFFDCDIKQQQQQQQQQHSNFLRVGEKKMEIE